MPGLTHGHAIAKHIQRTSEDALKVETGSLDPALHRLEARGWVAASWEGAQPSGVITMMVKRPCGLVLLGIALGLAAAIAASRWVESMFFGLTPTEPATIVEAALLLITAALIAAHFPARRAADVDPMSALRHE